MGIDWKSPENNERLLACLFQLFEEKGVKIDYKRISELFGKGATYNSIEGNFRKVRAAAKELKTESGGDGPSTPSGKTSAPKKGRTPKKDVISGVIGGRIMKTPSKKRGAGKVKDEEDDGEDLPLPAEEDGTGVEEEGGEV